MHTDI